MEGEPGRPLLVVTSTRRPTLPTDRSFYGSLSTPISTDLSHPLSVSLVLPLRNAVCGSFSADLPIEVVCDRLASASKSSTFTSRCHAFALVAVESKLADTVERQRRRSSGEFFTIFLARRISGSEPLVQSSQRGHRNAGPITPKAHITHLGHDRDSFHCRVSRQT